MLGGRSFHKGELQQQRHNPFLALSGAADQLEWESSAQSCSSSERQGGASLFRGLKAN